ncbi:MAG: hypothetical protein JNK81_16615 [Anaerolineales bacterium]|nr:hypothetical protein [Anaerolineales bacterium]
MKKNKVIIIFSLLIASCSSYIQPNNTSEPIINKTLTPTILQQTEMPSNLQAQTDTTSYKFLSPTIVQNMSSTMTFEVSGFLTTSTFAFRVDAFVPSGFEFQYPDYNYPNIYDSIEFSFTPDIEYQAMGGGGGSETLENTFNINSQIEHRVISQISSGQQFNLKAVVDFGEFTEITELVTFEILLIVP